MTKGPSGNRQALFFEVVGKSQYQINISTKAKSGKIHYFGASPQKKRV
jgi:hypothetical protein